MKEYPKLICTLSAGTAASQVDEWTQLRQRAASTERIHGGVALTFPADLFEEVSDLAAREADCCAFLNLATSRTDDHVRLAVTSEAPEALPVIEMLVGTPR